MLVWLLFATEPEKTLSENYKTDEHENFIFILFTYKRKAALPSHICFFGLTPYSFLLAMDECFGKCVAAHFTEEKDFLVK